jgi:hypothetical protein
VGLFQCLPRDSLHRSVYVHELRHWVSPFWSLSTLLLCLDGRNGAAVTVRRVLRMRAGTRAAVDDDENKAV